MCTDECGGDRHCPPRDQGLSRPPGQASHHNALGHHGERSTSPGISTNVPVPHAPTRRPEHRHIDGHPQHDGPQGRQPGAAALALRPDETGQLRQHHPSGTRIFGAPSHGELKTLAIILDAVTVISKTQQNQRHHEWVVIDAAGDFQIVRRLARQPLHKVTDSSLGMQALHLWVAMRNLPGHVALHLIKQESHRYNLSNRHIHLHAHNQLAEHVPTPIEPPLHDHMHTHLQHPAPIPHPVEPPPWVPDDMIYNETGRACHYPQPLRTLAHIRGNHPYNTLIARLHQELQMTL